MESTKVQKSKSEYEVAAEYFEENKTFSIRNFIPDHLVFDNILPRLPAKTLLRFKSACKDWLSYISSPEFWKIHHKFSNSSPRFLFDKLHEEHMLMWMISYDENNNSVTELSTLNCEHVDSHATLDELDNDGFDNIVGCCNGLVCLSLKEWDFGIWNPATHQFQRIPLCDSALELLNDPNDYLQSSKFCYASSIDDWKILTVCHDSSDLSTATFFLFSMRAGTWKRLSHLNGDYVTRDFYGCIVVYHSCNSVSVDGVLYMVYTDYNYDYHSFEDKLFAFDVVDENISQVPGTNWLTKYEYVRHASMIKGCLSLACIKEDQSCDVWMLKQRGDSDSWQKLFSYKDSFDGVLSFTDNGKLLMHHLGKLKLVDPTQDVSDNDVDDSQRIINLTFKITGQVFHYVESLIEIQIGK